MGIHLLMRTIIHHLYLDPIEDLEKLFRSLQSDRLLVPRNQLLIN